MEKVEEITIEKKTNPAKTHSLGIYIAILVLIAVVELIAGGFLYLKFAEKEQDMDERQELLYRQAASIEFKQVGIDKTESELELLSAELNTLQAELKVKEVQLQEQKKLLDSFRQSIKDTFSLLEPKKLAENMLNTYLEKYSRIDLSLPMPCEPRARAEYSAAKMHLEALLAAGEELGNDNKYTNFVADQKRQMSAVVVDCGDEENLVLINTSNQNQTGITQASAPQATSQQDISEEEFEEEEELVDDDLENEVDKEPQKTSQEEARVNIKVDLDSEMKRRDSAFESLE
ncbi:MAG: hypothetical protein D6B28_11360 [Gammaproteobacteria bacterium]|nr:MAG: hypothetical protein D6B28_11360 [Gammaproteobacteria bacterium]